MPWRRLLERAPERPRFAAHALRPLAGVVTAMAGFGPATLGGKRRVDSQDEGALKAAAAAVDKLNQENHSLWRHVLVGIDRGEAAFAGRGARPRTVTQRRAALTPARRVPPLHTAR